MTWVWKTEISLKAENNTKVSNFLILYLVFS